MNKNSLSVRKYSFDNLRCFLIICVVLGHLLELCAPNFISTLLYRIIYSFHMPLFIFLNGYFAKFNPIRIIKGYLIPYFLFQTLYLLFARNVLGLTDKFQYTTPYWILWYLLACLFYQLLIPFFDTKNPKKQLFFLTGALIFSLAIGFETTIGYFASLSRFFVFLPFFVLGLYYRKNEERMSVVSKKIKILAVGVSACVILWSFFFLKSDRISNSMLYGSYSYAKLEYSAAIRFCFLLFAFCWIILLVTFFKKCLNFKIPLLATVGQNTLPIFLLHGFVLRYLKYCCPKLNSAVFIILITVAVIAAFGNKYIGKVFKWLFSPRNKVS